MTSSHHPQRPSPGASASAALPAARRNVLAQWMHDIRHSNGWGYIFILPLVLDFLIFVVYLMVRGFTMSFQEIGYGVATWVGLTNYQVLFKDPQFYNALKNTTVYTIAVVPGQIFLALIFAELIFRRSPRVQSFFKGAYYLPTVVSTVALSLVWMFIYQPFYGILNYLVSFVGVPKTNWVGSPHTAMAALIVMGIINTMGASVVFLTAAMGSISPELYDAAKIDGASEWQRLWGVTVPMLRPTLLYLFVVGFIGNFQVFEQIYVMTAGGPGFPGRTESVGYLIFTAAFQSWRIGLAAAISVVLFLVILVFSIIQFRLFSADIEY
jgi:multiple sugar transport system permease protein